jgi:WD40 repeat protein
VHAWDFATGMLQYTLQDIGCRQVERIVSSPDSRYLASGSTDDRLRIWDITTGTLQLTLEDFESSIFAIAFSPDGKQIALSINPGEVQIRDTVTGVIQQKFACNSSERSVVFSPDGEQVITGTGVLYLASDEPQLCQNDVVNPL